MLHGVRVFCVNGAWDWRGREKPETATVFQEYGDDVSKAGGVHERYQPGSVWVTEGTDQW